MTDEEAQIVYYNTIVSRLNELYGTKTELEHEFINEFFEGDIPLFKLMLGADDAGKQFIIASFHIDIEAAIAIQWFLRIRQLEPNLHLTAGYLKDADGVSYVGEDAHILKMYTIEQEVLTAYVNSEKDPDEVLTTKVKLIKPNPIKAYSDYTLALNAFNKLDKQSGDTEH